MAIGAALLTLTAAVRPAPAWQTPEQTAPARPAGEDPEVSQMHVQALKTDDPDERLKIYEKILERDPGNADARAGFKEAKAAVEQKRTADREKQKQAAESRQKQAQAGAALRAAEQAFLTGDVAAARSKLNDAKSLGQTGARVATLESRLQRYDSRVALRRYVGFGALGALALGLLWWIASLFRKGQPYVEIFSGPSRGRRYPITKEVTSVGAVAKWGDETNDIVVSDPDKTVSRLHCEIHRKGKHIYLVDCNSSNGTRLDGRPAPAGRLVPLPRGARIQLGTACVLKFGYERRKS